MKKKKPWEEITMTGYVTATDWDWNDEVTAVSIETYDNTYAVEPNNLGEELLNEVDSEVEATGFVREDRDGTKQITITSYEVMSEAGGTEDEDYGYDDDGQAFGSEQGESPI